MIKKIFALLIFTAVFAAFYLLYLFMEANKAPVAFTLIGLGGRPPSVWNPPTFMLAFASFFAGLFSASVFFIVQSFRQSWRMRKLTQEIGRLKSDLSKQAKPQEAETASPKPEIQNAAQPASPEQ